jgi:hypothetical protein
MARKVTRAFVMLAMKLHLVQWRLPNQAMIEKNDLLPWLSYKPGEDKK